MDNFLKALVSAVKHFLINNDRNSSTPDTAAELRGNILTKNDRKSVQSLRKSQLYSNTGFR